MTRNPNNRFYTLDYLDVHLANIQRTAKLILENLRFFELKNQQKNAQWWRMRINNNEYLYNRSLNALLEYLLQIKFLGKAYKGQVNGKLASSCTRKLSGAAIMEKIQSLDKQVKAFLSIVKKQCENEFVLALKLEGGTITYAQWNRYLTQLINLSTRLQSYSFPALVKRVKSEKPDLPEQLPDNIERDFKLISRKVLMLERSLAGLRVYVAHLNLYINLNGSGIDEVEGKELPTWKLKYQLLTYLIELILGMRLVGKKNPPEIRVYDWQKPEGLTIGFMLRISNRLISWLNKLRAWVIEIDDTITLYRISSVTQHAVFFENWTRFKHAFLPLKDTIDLEMALIECQQPGWLRRYSERSAKKSVHHKLAG